jgi:hypothetical protein
MRELTELEFSYVAGLIDADGCIQAPKGNSIKNRNTGKFRLEIHVIQRDINLIKYLYESFDGSFNIIKRNHKSGIKYYFRWMITGPKAGRVLKGILPYLHLKKKQAELGLELQSLIRTQKFGYKRSLPLEIVERRKQLALEIKNLNSPTTTERDNSNLEMQQSELMRMINHERIGRRTDSAS